jgi:replicative DNA helicase
MMGMETPLPANLEAERLILGTVLRDNDLLADARPALSESDFSIDQHRRIWRAIESLYDSGKPVKHHGLVEELQRTRNLEAAGGYSYVVADLDEQARKVRTLDDAIEIIRGKAFLRKIINAAELLRNRALEQTDSPDQISQYASKLLLDMAETPQPRGFLAPADVIQEHGIDRILSPRREHGIPLPWPWLDYYLAGLHSEQLIVLGGATSRGKTSAALEIAVHASRHFREQTDGRQVYIFSLEMSADELIAVMVAQLSRVDARRHDKTPAERHEQARAANLLLELPIRIDDTAASNTAKIHAALRAGTLKYGRPGLVIVDYLQILGSAGRFENRTQEVGHNARQLKLVAKSLRCPFLVLSQIHRREGNEWEPPTLRDLRQSGEIEESANVVLFVHAEEHQPGVQEIPSQFIIAKQRRGPRDLHRKMIFRAPIQTFEESDESGSRIA